MFLLKNDVDDLNYYVEAQYKLGDLMKKYQIGFDILYSSASFINSTEEPFCKIDILFYMPNNPSAKEWLSFANHDLNGEILVYEAGDYFSLNLKR